MSGAERFVPIDRRLAIRAGRDLPERVEGAVLFADIPGFTAFSEALRRRLGPRRGAEELVRHLDATYAALIAEVHRYGGSVISFGGDAITCWFDDKLPEDTEQSGAHARRATRCALEMQAVMARIEQGRRRGEAGLAGQIKAAVVGGPARRFLLGRRETQVLEGLTGRVLERAAHAAEVTRPGEVLVGAEVIGRFGQDIEIEDWRTAEDGEHYAVVSGLRQDPAPEPWPEDLRLSDEEARPWLLPAVYERVRRGEGAFLAQLRPIVSVFLAFGGIDYDRDDEALARLGDYVAWVQSVLDHYEGALMHLLIGDKGSHAVLVFGAPAAQEDDAARACAASLALLRPPAELASLAAPRIGIARGTMLAGAFGGPRRATYSVQGAEMSLAARLMGRAQEGQILVAPPLETALEGFALRSLGPMRLKGLPDALEIHELRGRVRGERRDALSPAEAGLVGRREERDLLRARLAALAEGRGGTLWIEGEPGIGKSTLLRGVLAREDGDGEAPGWTARSARGDAVERGTPYHALRSVVRASLALPADATDADPVAALAARLGDAEDAAARAPLLAPVLGVEIPESELSRRLSEAGRASRTRELIVEILVGRDAARPLLLVLEDAQWVDSATWDVLELARTRHPALLLVVLTRPREQGRAADAEERLRGADETRRVALGPLPDEDIEALCRVRLGVARVPRPVLDLVIARAEGQPYFAEEILRALLESGQIEIEGEECLLLRRPEALDFPVTVQGVIGSRLDRLQLPEQLTLRVASVIGRVFGFDTLRDIHPIEGDRPYLPAQLDTLSAMDVTPVDRPPPDLRYRFKHGILHETVYNQLLFAQRRRLHRAVAEWLEARHAEQVGPHVPQLAHHWRHAVEASADRSCPPRLLASAIYYLDRAGQHARRNGAYPEAVGFFETVLRTVEEHGLEPPRSRVALWRRWLGESYHQWGQWSEARSALEEAAGLLRRPVPRSRAGLGLGLLTQALRQAWHRLRRRSRGARPSGFTPGRSGELASIYLSLSEVLYLTNEEVGSLYAVLVALNESERAGTSPELALSYRNLAVISDLFGAHKLAADYAARALRTAELVADPATTAAVKLGVGMYHLEAGRLREARPLVEDARALAETYGDPRLWGDCMGFSARIATFLGDLDRAEALYREMAGPRCRTLLHKAWSLSSLGGVALRRQRDEEAIEILREALDAQVGSAEAQQEIVGWAYLALARLRREDPEGARAAADRAREVVAASSVASHNLFEAFGAIGDVYAALWDRAARDGALDAEQLEARLAECCRRLRTRAMPLGEPAARLAEGELAWRRGDRDAATAAWRQGLEKAEAQRMPYEAGRLHALLAVRLPAEQTEARATHRAAAEAALRELGVQEPLRDLEGAG